MSDLEAFHSEAAAIKRTRYAAPGLRHSAAPLRLGRLRLSVDRTWCWFLLGLALLLAGFLIGPRVPAEAQQQTCIGNVDLPGPLGFGLNCDSPQFNWLAREPSGLLEPGNARQARPGFILTAWLLQSPLAFVLPPGGPPQPVESGLQNPQEISASFARDLPAYVAYIVLNIAILGASFLMLRRLLDFAIGMQNRSTSEMMIVVSAGLLLVANDVTKAFVWSPHTQLFNIFVPVMAVYATLRVWFGALHDRRFAVLVGTVTGIGITAYPVFVVVPVCCLLPALVRVIGDVPRQRRSMLLNLALLLTLSALPSVLWYAFVRMTTGSFFHFEMAQGEVVWMADAWARGATALVATWLGHAAGLLTFAASQAIAIAALLVLAGWAAFRAKRPLMALRPAYPTMVAALYVSLAILGFYTSVGWIVDRLAYPMLPPLLVGATAALLAALPCLTARARWQLAAGAAILAAAQISYVIIKDGPWS